MNQEATIEEINAVLKRAFDLDNELYEKHDSLWWEIMEGKELEQNNILSTEERAKLEAYTKIYKLMQERTTRLIAILVKGLQNKNESSQRETGNQS